MASSLMFKTDPGRSGVGAAVPAGTICTRGLYICGGDCSSGGHTASTERRRWGTDTLSYGGVGGAVRQGGVVSRSHRHYGTGNINCYAREQPYRVTELLLSDCRPCDQQLPPPLLTGEIIRHQQKLKYPTNHTYTSHQSKCAVFPSALPGGGLTQRTTDSLKRLHNDHYCTTMYEQMYRDHQQWERRGGCCSRACAGSEKRTLGAGETARLQCGGCRCGEVRIVKAQELTLVGKSEDGCDWERLRQCTCVAIGVCGGAAKTGCHGDICGGATKTGCHGDICGGAAKTDNVCSVFKSVTRVHWDDMVADSNGAKTQGEERQMREDKERGEQQGGEEGEKREGDRGREAVAVTQLPLLPDHFRRVATKYYRNKLSPLCPCTIPFHLDRPHSVLPAYISNTPEVFASKLKVEEEKVTKLKVEEEKVTKLKVEEEKVTARDGTAMAGESGTEESGEEEQEETVTERGDRERDTLPLLPPITGASFTCGNEGGDVTGGSPSVSPLTTMLHVSGSRVPHRLGVRFRTQAHTRFHQLYSDKTPDLRRSRVESKRYFFCDYQYHSSVFRGS